MTKWPGSPGIAEEPVAEWVITYILDQGSAVSITMRHTQVLVGCAGVLLQQEGFDLFVPSQINDLFVRQNGICAARLGKGEDEQH